MDEACIPCTMYRSKHGRTCLTTYVWVNNNIQSTMIINIALTGSCCWLMYNLLTLTCDKRLDFHKTSRVLCIKDNMYYSLWGYTRYTCSYLRLIIVLLEVGTVTSRGTIHYPEIRLVKIHVFPCCVFIFELQQHQAMIVPRDLSDLSTSGFCIFVNHLQQWKLNMQNVSYA